jgi:hypothetical protein
MAPFFRCVTNGQQPTNSDTQPNEEGQVRVYGYHENLNQRISTGEQIECTTLLSVNVLTGDSMDVDQYVIQSIFEKVWLNMLIFFF